MYIKTDFMLGLACTQQLIEVSTSIHFDDVFTRSQKIVVATNLARQTLYYTVQSFQRDISLIKGRTEFIVDICWPRLSALQYCTLKYDVRFLIILKG